MDKNKIKDFNRNLIGGKRPHRKMQRLAKENALYPLTARLKADCEALRRYQIRVGQYKPKKSK